MHDALRLRHAAWSFFSSPVSAGSRRKRAPKRPPSIYRDARTKLVRCFYREMAIHFRPEIPDDRRASHLRDFNLELVRTSRYAPHQLIVRDPEDRLRGDDLIAAANSLAERDSDIVYATPNFVSEFKRAMAPIPRNQWHLENTGQFDGQTSGEDVRAKEAWQVTTGSPSTVVAVLDDGVDIDHPALRGQMWRNPDVAAPDQFGRDYWLDPSDSGFNDPRPKEFGEPFNDVLHNDIHGTACSGLVAANAPDGRALGVAPDCRILAVKIFHGGFLASEERVALAIQYAAGIADVLSCSWSAGESTAIQQAIEAAASTGRNGKGCPVVCATGDDGGNKVAFPANLNAAIAVGASTDQGTLAGYSNFGEAITIVAPSHGGSRGVFTTDVSMPNRGFNPGSDDDGGADGLYTNSFGGTSAAAAIAAGVAAVVLSRRPDLRADEVKMRLEQTADKIGDDYDGTGHSNLYGYGRVNAFAAIGNL